MKLLFTFLLLLGYCALHAQEVGCGTTTEPFDIEDSTEVAKRTPYYRFDAAASLIYLQDKGYKLKESYLQKIQEDVPAIYSRFKKQDNLQGKKMENDANHIMARGSGMEYMEVRFWRHLDAYTNIPYVSEAAFQNDIAIAIGHLNQAFQDHDIPIRFYASCGNHVFHTTKYNPVSQEISKGDAGDVVDIIPVNSNHGLDVLYFAGKIMSSGESINFARFPWDSKNYRVAY